METKMASRDQYILPILKALGSPHLAGCPVQIFHTSLSGPVLTISKMSLFQGFFKSLKILKENFGNVFIHFAKPISCREFFGDKFVRKPNLQPLHHQEITEDERALIPSLSYEILSGQQQNSVLSTFNLMCLLLNVTFSRGHKSVSMEKLVTDLEWIKGILEELGGYVFEKNIFDGIHNALNVHENLLALNSNREVNIIIRIFNNISLEV